MTLPGIDFFAARDVLAAHDFPALQARLEQSLRRRLLMKRVGMGAMLTIIVAAAAVTLRDSTPPEPERAPSPSAPPLISDAPIARPLPREHAPSETHVGEMHVGETHVGETTAPPPSAGGRDAREAPRPREHASSRLRAQLELYERAQQSSSEDPSRALALVGQLLETYPDGPLVVEAGLLQVTVLARLGRSEDATERLMRLETAAAAAGKRDAWANAKAALAAPRAPEDADGHGASRVLR